MIGAFVVEDNLDDARLGNVGSGSDSMDIGSRLTNIIGWDASSGPMLG